MITSMSNPQIKNLSALVKKSKERKNQKLFVAEGPRMCFEAPKDWLVHIYVAESFWRDRNRQASLAAFLDSEGLDAGDICDIVSDSAFQSVSDTQTPQGIMAVLKMPQYQLQDLLRDGNPHLLVLEGIQDPGNLGTMLRTGEGAGISGIIMNRTTVDLFNPKTIRATMGSIYRVPFFVAEDLPGVILQLKTMGIHLYAAHLEGSVSYDVPDYSLPTGFLIGNEGKGLSSVTASLSDKYVRIPMQGQVESLNAAIAATLFMYECSRQRRRTNENLV